MQIFTKLKLRGVLLPIFAGLVTAGLFCVGVYVFATYGTDEPYPFGNTLNPSCNPGETNCTTTPLSAYSFGSNNFSGTGTFTTTGTGTFGQIINNGLSASGLVMTNASKQFITATAGIDYETPVNKNQPSGYPGLDSNGDLVGILIPRTDTNANLSSMVLEAGELATTSDTHKILLGDGVTPGGIDFLTNSQYSNISDETNGYQVDSLRVITNKGNSGSEDIFLGQSGNFTMTGINNIFGGYQSGYSTTSGGSNVFLGYKTGYSDTTGGGNIAIGYEASYSNTKGVSLISLGYQAGRYFNLTTTGEFLHNFFAGYQAGYGSATSTGADNTFIGYQAGYSTTTGAANNFFGHSAGYLNTTGSNNNFFGREAGYWNVTGYNNNFFGNRAGYKNDSGINNNFFGNLAGEKNTTGTNNNFFGTGSGGENTTGSYNNFFGNSAGDLNTTGGDNNFFGSLAGYFNTSGRDNNFFGRTVAYNNTTGGSNDFFGYQAGWANTTGSYNIAIGNNAAYSNTTGTDIIALGYQAGYYFKKTDGSALNNFFAGNGAGYGSATSAGANNTFIGYQSGYKTTTGYSNNFLGNKAGWSNTSGYYNNFLGYQSGYTNTSGTNNNFLGYQAGYLNSTGIGNNFFGYQAGYSSTANNNNFFGYSAGYSNTTGYNNTFLGSTAGYANSTGSSDVFIGSGAGYYETGSNKLFIDNQIRASEADGRSKALIYGIFGTTVAGQSVTINGNTNFSAGLTTLNYGTAAPTFTTNGQIAVTYEGAAARIRFYANGTSYYIDKTGGFGIPGNETVDPISGEKMQIGDFVLGMVNQNLEDADTEENSSLHGVWVKWSSVKAQLLAELAGSTTTSWSGAVAAGTVSGVDTTTLIDKVTNALSSLGITISNGVTNIANLAVEKSTTKTARVEKLEMVDSATGEIYCTWVENGEWVKSKGECASVSTTTVVTQSSVSVDTVAQIVQQSQDTAEAAQQIAEQAQTVAQESATQAATEAATAAATGAVQQVQEQIQEEVTQQLQEQIEVESTFENVPILEEPVQETPIIEETPAVEEIIVPEEQPAESALPSMGDLIQESTASLLNSAWEFVKEILKLLMSVLHG